MDEADLIHRARQGDEAAWEALVAGHREAVFRLAYLLLGSADDAEDIAQEAFIRSYRSLARFDTVRPFRPWVLRIAANLAKNRRRAVGRYLGALRRAFAPEPESSAEAESTSAWEAHQLWQAVRRLKADDQEIIYLRYFLELSVMEAADALDVAPGTVKSRTHRALGHLRAVMERDFPALVEERSG